MLIKLHCNLPFNWKYFVEWRKKVETHNAGDNKVGDDQDLYDDTEDAEIGEGRGEEVEGDGLTAGQ